MMPFLQNMLRRGRKALARATQEPWRCDPLAHPVLDRMTPAELGDLPLGEVCYDCSTGR